MDCLSVFWHAMYVFFCSLFLQIYVSCRMQSKISEERGMSVAS